MAIAVQWQQIFPTMVWHHWHQIFPTVVELLKLLKCRLTHADVPRHNDNQPYVPYFDVDSNPLTFTR